MCSLVAYKKWITGSSFWNFVINSSKEAWLLSWTLFQHKHFCFQCLLDGHAFTILTYFLVILSNSWRNRLFTASLIFTRHPKGAKRDIQKLCTWHTSTYSQRTNDFSISKRFLTDIGISWIFIYIFLCITAIIGNSILETVMTNMN